MGHADVVFVTETKNTEITSLKHAQTLGDKSQGLEGELATAASKHGLTVVDSKHDLVVALGGD